MTKCQFNRLKGDTSQTLFTLRALSKFCSHIDVVFAPDDTCTPELTGEIPRVQYHAVKNPQEAAICLWAIDRESCVVSRGIGFTVDMIGAIPKKNLFAFLYGNHWKAPDDLLLKIRAGCNEIITQNIS